MSDLLLEITQSPAGRRLVKTLGLPVPVPEKLERARGPYEERPLAGRAIVVGGSGPLGAALAAILPAAGADCWLAGIDPAPWAAPGEAWGRPAERLAADAEPPERLRAHALVFDASGLDGPGALGALHTFFHPWLGRLGRSGRVLLLGRPVEEAASPAAAAASAALDGFVRSVAKEIGGLGATANLVQVARGAEERLAPLVRFLLSPRSAYVTGQPFRVTGTVRPAGAYPVTRPLEGKVALVTGAARGIGAATAARMAEEGAHVVVLDRPDDDGPASKTAREVGGSLLLCDVSDPAAADRIAADLREKHGGVDVVVHNAGVTRDRTLRKMPPEVFGQAIDINLGAVVRITDALLSGKKPLLRDGGRIVCLSSVAGIAGNMGQTNYAASKAGIIGFVRRLAPDLARRGIAVNAVAPGFIETRLTAAMPVMVREVARRLSALGQGGQPEDVAEVLTFLSSPGADGITGSVVRVCGGAYVGA